MTDEDTSSLKEQNRFHSDVLDCWDSQTTAMYAFVCCPCAMATARAQVDGSNWWTNCVLASLFPNCTVSMFRYFVRDSYDLEGNIFEDCLTGLLCPCCATAQMLREVHNFISQSNKIV